MSADTKRYVLKLDPVVVHIDGSLESCAPTDRNTGMTGPFVYHEPFTDKEEALRTGFRAFHGCLVLPAFQACSGARITVLYSGTDTVVAGSIVMRGWLICPACGECYPKNPMAFIVPENTEALVQHDVLMYDRTEKKLVCATQVRKVEAVICRNCYTKTPISSLYVDVDMAAYGPLGTRFMSMRQTENGR